MCVYIYIKKLVEVNLKNFKIEVQPNGRQNTPTTNAMATKTVLPSRARAFIDVAVEDVTPVTHVMSS